MHLETLADFQKGRTDSSVAVIHASQQIVIDRTVWQEGWSVSNIENHFPFHLFASALPKAI